VGSLPEAARGIAKFATGVAIALFVANAAASAQDIVNARAAADGCRSWSTAAPLSPAALSRCFYKASVRVSRVAKHTVSFETQDSASEETALALADAATVTSEALVNLVDRPGGKVALARITTVRFAIGSEPSAHLANGVLTVTIAPSRGIAGRPTEGQIEIAARAS
jgi:hypothetical protein